MEDGTAIVDPMFQSNELAAYLTEKQNLAVEWRNGVFDRLSTGSKMDVETGERQKFKDGRIWQLKPEADLMIHFVGYDDLIKDGYGEPDPDNYRVVYDGQIDANDLKKSIPNSTSTIRRASRTDTGGSGSTVGNQGDELNTLIV